MAFKTPQDWHKSVIKYYGSLSAFQDRTTVEYIRDQIASRKEENQEFLDTVVKYPGIAKAEDVAKIQSENDELSSLDEELSRWQADRAAQEKHTTSTS